MSTVLLRNIGELCTCDGARGEAPGVVTDAALVAVDGVITYVGTESSVDRASLAGDVEEHDLDGAAVVPGFVDSHTHLVWLGDRAEEYASRAAGVRYQEIAAHGGGIRATVAATAAGDVAELAHAAEERARRMLRHGTTTLEIKSGYGIAHDAEMRQLDAARALHARGGLPDVMTTYLPLHAAPDGDRAAFLNDVCARGVHDAAERATFADAFCDVGAYTVDECARFFEAAIAAGLRPKVHAEQLAHTGGAQLAARAGAVSADHLEHATEEDLRALQRAGVVATILPGASLGLDGPPAPGRRALDAGCRVAIATDCNPGTCYCESMPLMCSLAVASAGLTPGQALVAATAGGAAALGLTDRGVVRPGARCDVAVLASRRWLEVAYHLGGDVVDRVFIGADEA
ncbi:MAG: imidazolonepropionase [Candidatus Dormibacteria bacterium]